MLNTHKYIGVTCSVMHCIYFMQFMTLYQELWTIFIPKMPYRPSTVACCCTDEGLYNAKKMQKNAIYMDILWDSEVVYAAHRWNMSQPCYEHCRESDQRTGILEHLEEISTLS